MKIPEMNKVYVLNPHYHLRHDIHRVALFSSTGTDTDCSRNWHTFIHPLQAVMLSFFTYDRPLQTTLPLLCDFFCRSKEEMIKWVSDFIDNPTPIYTSSQQGEIYFPKRILIEAEKAGKALRFDRLQANSFVWKKLDLTTKRLYSGPLLLTFMLTNQCVTHCKYCYADTSTQIKSPLTTQRMMELIKEASDLQVQQVNLIGGEIFLHKDWKIILKELVKRGIAPEFISTKMPVTQKLLQDVQETGYQGIVQISLDAIHSEILTASLGVNGNYAKEMLHGLQLLDDSGLNYQISSVLTNYNCQLNVLAELLHELSHLKHIRDWRIIPASNSIYKEYNVFSHLKRKYSINSLVYWVTYVHNVVYSFYRSMIYCYINSTQRCAGSIVIDIIPTNGADKRKFFPFAPYFPVTNVIKRYFYPYFPAIIGIKGYSFPYFPYLSGIMKIKTALYSLFSRLDWHKTVVFPCLGEIYEGIRSLSWEIPVT